ncbi:MAG: hypothetical protein LBJ82_04115, partial [Deltaproteobacteria bacterium]|nr:hypothetical protein [Deltaproteobacteria bacterium]
FHLLRGGFFSSTPLLGKRIIRIDSRFSKTAHALQYLLVFSLKLLPAGVRVFRSAGSAVRLRRRAGRPPEQGRTGEKFTFPVTG